MYLWGRKCSEFRCISRKFDLRDNADLRPPVCLILCSQIADIYNFITPSTAFIMGSENSLSELKGGRLSNEVDSSQAPQVQPQSAVTPLRQHQPHLDQMTFTSANEAKQRTAALAPTQPQQKQQSHRFALQAAVSFGRLQLLSTGMRVRSMVVRTEDNAEEVATIAIDVPHDKRVRLLSVNALEFGHFPIFRRHKLAI